MTCEKLLIKLSTKIACTIKSPFGTSLNYFENLKKNHHFVFSQILPWQVLEKQPANQSGHIKLPSKTNKIVSKTKNLPAEIKITTNAENKTLHTIRHLT